jgi:hypothetical protein
VVQWVHLCLFFFLWGVLGEEVEDEDLGPFHAFVDGDEDAAEELLVDFDVLFP